MQRDKLIIGWKGKNERKKEGERAKERENREPKIEGDNGTRFMS